MSLHNGTYVIGKEPRMSESSREQYRYALDKLNCALDNVQLTNREFITDAMCSTLRNVCKTCRNAVEDELLGKACKLLCFTDDKEAQDRAQARFDAVSSHLRSLSTLMIYDIGCYFNELVDYIRANTTSCEKI
jgi:hypothetical protein